MGESRGKLTYANVMATIAVFIALGSGAYAAVQLPKNSVGTKQLKKGSVTGAKVANATLTGANLNLSTLGTVPSAANAQAATTRRARRPRRARRLRSAPHTRRLRTMQLPPEPLSSPLKPRWSTASKSAASTRRS